MLGIYVKLMAPCFCGGECRFQTEVQSLCARIWWASSQDSQVDCHCLDWFQLARIAQIHHWTIASVNYLPELKLVPRLHVSLGGCNFCSIILAKVDRTFLQWTYETSGAAKPQSLASTLSLHLEMVTLRCHVNPTEVLLKQVAFGHRLIWKGSLPWFSPRNKRWSLRESWEMWDASWELRAWRKSCDAWTQRWRAPHGDSRKMSFHVPLSNCNLSYVYANS